MEIPIDYETLRVVWWLLLGVLLIGFAVTDGFDLGTGMLLPFVGTTDVERRIVINTVGPVWEGNQVWLITGGGAIFAAWPYLYALSFSGFYLAMLLVLAALILRPVGFKFRSKLADTGWRRFWDWALFVGGFVPALLFGVAVGNVIRGVPFHYDETLRPIYDGGLLGLLNPFALLAGVVSVAMLAMHGGVWLAVKTADPIAARARIGATVAAVALILLFALAGLWVAYGLDGYVVTAGLARGGASNPTLKEAIVEPGAWLSNYGLYAWAPLAPILGFAGAALVPVLLRTGMPGIAFVASSLSVAGVVATAGVSIYPFLLPSSTVPSHSLTVFDASSSAMTLFVLLIATGILMPLVLAYTAWVYRVLWGKVTAADLDSNENSY